jgi:indole-3-glycerol phosphate synthase
MSSFLKTILECKREEVRRLAKDRARFRDGRSDEKRGFVQSLNKRPHLALVAELKKASPSKGVIRPDFDPVATARKYAEGNADAISVLTDERFFQGRLSELEDVRRAAPLPVLRKDFVIDPVQIEQTAHANADAVLLIAAALSDSQMQELYEACGEFDIDALIEVHNTTEFERVMKLSPAALGINNRNLDTFEVSLETTLAIVPHAPRDTIVVSESGIFTANDTARLAQAGVHAVLVGESLMRSDDPAALIRELKAR